MQGVGIRLIKNVPFIPHPNVCSSPSDKSSSKVQHVAQSAHQSSLVLFVFVAVVQQLVGGLPSWGSFGVSWLNNMVKWLHNFLVHIGMATQFANFMKQFNRNIQKTGIAFKVFRGEEKAAHVCDMPFFFDTGF
jgi:hypothetical protein